MKEQCSGEDGSGALTPQPAKGQGKLQWSPALQLAPTENPESKMVIGLLATWRENEPAPAGHGPGTLSTVVETWVSTCRLAQIRQGSEK